MLNTDKLCPGCMNDNGGEKICSFCGYDAASRNDADKLSTRFWLAERYMVGKVLSESSEGVTYLGWDNIENVPVNIREYFPSGVAHRNEDLSVTMDVNHKFAFNEGLMAFMELNKKLMPLELPSLVEVLDVFEENGTAYAISASVAGITLASFLERNGGSLKWEQIRPLLLPLIDTVKGLHDERIIHGGISPETIIVGRDGKLRLTGISILSTRCAGGEIPAQVYSGYAAAEQYGVENLTIGAYTDVYGLSATLFRAIIGVVPPDAENRLINDSMEIPAHFADELPRQVLVAMANGLQVRPETRTTTVESFKNELVYGETQENARKAAAAKRAQEAAAAKRAQEAAAARRAQEQAQISSRSTPKPAPAPKAAPAPKKAEKAVNKNTAPKAPKEKGSSGAKAAIISALCTALIIIIPLSIFAWINWDNMFGNGNGTKTNNTAYTSSKNEDDDKSDELTKLYRVPDFTGMYYADVIAEEDYDRFEFVIVDKQFSDKVARGKICSQSVKENADVAKDTKIELVISLGPSEIELESVTGKTEKEAIETLLKQGFLYENIVVEHQYNENKAAEKIIAQEPKAGGKVSADSRITIYVNDFTGSASQEN